MDAPERSIAYQGLDCTRTDELLLLSLLGGTHGAN